jgi:hypothetical protein
VSTLDIRSRNGLHRSGYVRGWINNNHSQAVEYFKEWRGNFFGAISAGV